MERTASLIKAGKVVGWFQGRMEWGPRALGARSILSDPTNPRMKETLNLKVKHRERFRPFAPAVCEDDAQEFFECDSPLPDPASYMLMVYPIRKKHHKRLQVVKREQSPLYYDLIKEFGRQRGVPVLVNTSFNIRGEPIVCSPVDAYRCMMGTGIDCLVMGKFLIKRSDNLQDEWDSEVLAND